MSICNATTKSGNPCKYKAKNNGFCGVHKNFISIDDLTSKVEDMVIEEVESDDEDWDEWNATTPFIKRLLACKAEDMADLLRESRYNTTHR